MRVAFNDFLKEYDSIKDEIDKAVSAVLSGGRFIGGEVVHEFESRFAEFSGSKYCLSCGNGTDALEIILEGLEIGRGDEVLVPACSWISTSGVVTGRGALPVFVDVLDDYYTIDPNRLEEKITSATRAIIPVHLYGLPAEMDAIMDFAGRHDLYVVEDCAHAHGAAYRGRPVGTFGAASAFSFYPTKNLGAYGDGGAIVTEDSDLLERFRLLANHGQPRKDEHLIEGRNSRLDVLQAAILLVKLKHVGRWIQHRQKNARAYDRLLGETLIIPRSPDYSNHVYYLYVVRVENRPQVQSELAKLGIETLVHYPNPLPLLPAYARHNHTAADFPVAVAHMDKLLSLPVHPFLGNDEIRSVGQKLSQIILEPLTP